MCVCVCKRWGTRASVFEKKHLSFGLELCHRRCKSPIVGLILEVSVDKILTVHVTEERHRFSPLNTRSGKRLLGDAVPPALIVFSVSRLQ